jgi:hypothetical protein
MVRCSKLQLIVSVLLVTGTFLFLQLFFMNLLKNSGLNSQLYVSDSLGSAENTDKNVKTTEKRNSTSRRFNPRFNFRMSTISSIEKFSTTFNVQRINSKTKTELKIPFNRHNNKPEIIYQLPFYLKKKNYLNLTLVNVTYSQNSNDNIDRENFLEIEMENRQINPSQLEKPLQNDNEFYKNIRGINKANYELYKPHMENYFKCINSNVKLKRDYFCFYKLKCLTNPQIRDKSFQSFKIIFLPLLELLNSYFWS